MDDAVLVGVAERARRFAGEPEGLLERNAPVARQSVAERLPFDEWHHVVEMAARGTGIVDRHDVGVLEAGGELDLTEEPLGADRGGEIRLEDLDRDRTPMLDVLGQEDRGHPPLADLAFEGVVTGEMGGERVEQVGHLGVGWGCSNLAGWVAWG